MRRRCRRAIFLRHFGTVSTNQRQVPLQRFPNYTPTHTMPMHRMHHTPMTHGPRITNNTQQQHTTTGNRFENVRISWRFSAIYCSVDEFLRIKLILYFIFNILEPSTNTIIIIIRWHNTEVYSYQQDYRITRSTNRLSIGPHRTRPGIFFLNILKIL